MAVGVGVLVAVAGIDVRVGGMDVRVGGMDVRVGVGGMGVGVNVGGSVMVNLGESKNATLPSTTTPIWTSYLPAGQVPGTVDPRTSVVRAQR